jgi:CRISPR-associated exonuclease Cas4
MNGRSVLIFAALTGLALALVMRWYARRRLEALDVTGAIIYWDSAGSAETFTSDRHGLTGRPDYVLRSGDELVPVERKSRAVGGREPHDGERLQLAAYCLLVEERFARPVRRGQLQYADRTLAIPFDDHLRAELAAALNALREAECQTDVSRNHNSAARCRSCGFRADCGQSLAR